MTRLEKCKLAIRKGFTYDEKSGFITTPNGTTASKTIKSGYIMLTLREKSDKAYYLYGHHFAWFYKYNDVTPLIDHINRIKSDNSIANLRKSNKSKNGMNRDNVKGFYFSKEKQKYISIIMINYKRKQLGTFKTEEEARECYLKNKEIYHKLN